MTWHPGVQECHLLCGMLQAGKVRDVLDLIIKNAMIILVSTPIYVCLPTKICSIMKVSALWKSLQGSQNVIAQGSQNKSIYVEGLTVKNKC